MRPGVQPAAGRQKAPAQSSLTLQTAAADPLESGPLKHLSLGACHHRLCLPVLSVGWWEVSGGGQIGEQPRRGLCPGGGWGWVAGRWWCCLAYSD